MSSEDVGNEERSVSVVDGIFAELGESTPQLLGGGLFSPWAAAAGDVGPVAGPAAIGHSQSQKEASGPAGSRKRKRLAEERKQRPKLKLKHNGEEMDVASALACLRDIRFVGDSKDRLEALVELAHGHPEKMTEEIRKSAKAFGLLNADRSSLRNEYRAVLLSAVEDTPDGPMLLNNPFALKSEGDKLVAEREQRLNDRRWRKIRGLPLDDDIPIDDQEFRSR